MVIYLLYLNVAIWFSPTGLWPMFHKYSLMREDVMQTNDLLYKNGAIIFILVTLVVESVRTWKYDWSRHTEKNGRAGVTKGLDMFL